jgi:hypothetical protein
MPNLQVTYEIWISAGKFALHMLPASFATNAVNRQASEAQ